MSETKKPETEAAWSAATLGGKLIIVALFSVVCLTWGTTWLGIKVAIETVPPIFASGLRFLIAFPLLLTIAKLQRVPLRFPKGEGGLFLMSITLYFAVPYLLINVGEEYVSSGLAALLFSTMPVFTLIFSNLLLRERIWGIQVIGIALGMFSLLMILHGQGVGMGFRNVLGAAAILFAAVFHAFWYVTSKKRGADISVVTLNTLPMGIAGLVLALTGLIYEHPSFSAISAMSAWALVYLGLVATVGGFLAYFYLLKRLRPVVLSFVFLIFPVIAVILSGWIEHKHFTYVFAAYCALLLFGFSLTRLQVELLGVARVVLAWVRRDSVSRQGSSS